MSVEEEGPNSSQSGHFAKPKLMDGADRTEMRLQKVFKAFKRLVNEDSTDNNRGLHCFRGELRPIYFMLSLLIQFNLLFHRQEAVYKYYSEQSNVDITSHIVKGCNMAPIILISGKYFVERHNEMIF